MAKCSPPWFAAWAWQVMLCGCAWGAEPDISKLPPPATQQVDFTRDIAPVLDGHCLKCHSGEKPKSQFRLTSRDAALRGGEHGLDIIPGQSARSPLVLYIAGLVEDMQMPPEGRGTPLTPREISLVRAWIDQGVPWAPSTNAPPVVAIASPTAGWTGVHGDDRKFRELMWQPQGWNGGLEDFTFSEKPGPNSRVTLSGHTLRDDYDLNFTAEKEGLGFAHLGWSQFRKYFDDAGGFDPLFSPAQFQLNRDLGLDIGRAWTELGLTLPRWPVLTLGYEYQYRNGTESTLDWGPVSNSTDTRNLYPAYKDVAERVHILKAAINYDLAGAQLSDEFRGEWFHLQTHEMDAAACTLGSPGIAFTTADERQNYFQGANTFHAEKQFTDWFFAAGGYLYSKLDSSGSVDVQTLDPEFLNLTANAAPGWQSQAITLERESHVFSLSGLLGPWEGLSFSLATQNEWTRQNGLSGAAVTLALPFAPFIFPVDVENLLANLDERIFTQDAAVRFTKIPFTTLFAEARFRQDDLGQYQEEQNGLTPFLTQIDARSRLEDFRAGFDTSPCRRLSFSGSYRQNDDETDYNPTLKQALGGAFVGYPAFILYRDLLSREADGKLALQVNSWLKTTLTYQWLANRYRTGTESVNDPLSGLAGGISPGGQLLAGTYNAQMTSLNATLTPWRKLFFCGTVTYQHARTVTADNGTTAVIPYSGNVYSLILSGNYALNNRTSLLAAYSFSAASFGQDNFATGLPLGLNYHQHALEAGLKREISRHTALGLQYRFYRYSEPSAGGTGNFDAHAIFATFTCKLP